MSDVSENPASAQLGEADIALFGSSESVKRWAYAVGEGSAAFTAVHQHLASMS
jgi:hypothetical protein